MAARTLASRRIHRPDADGGDIVTKPMNFSPCGGNGGYYYARVTFTF
jgi:hypothetical protein